MTPVSTSAQLLSSLKLDDFIYGFVGKAAEDGDTPDNGVSLWNIPGLGTVGVGAATVAIVALYIAHPEIKETFQTLSDLFGENTDEKLDGVAESLGKKGEEVQPNAQPADEKPRVSAQPLALPTVKAEPQVQVHPKQEEQQPSAATVSRGYQMQGSGMPLPSGPLARPTAEIDQVLRNTAKTEGVDYRTLYALGGSESSFSAGANAKNSSATGLFQFTAPTWTYLTQKMYPELGYTSGDRMDPQKSAIVAARYVKQISASLQKKIGRQPSIGETYLGYFMGPTGAGQFLDALTTNPNAKGADVFPNAAKSNPYLFYHKGDKTKPLTLQETMSRLEGKVMAYYEQAGAPQVAQAEAAPPVASGGGPKALPVKAALPSTASPQAIPVPAPDFTAFKGGAKGEARNQEQPAEKTQVAQQGSPAPIVTSTPGKKEQAGEATYMRDKQGRLIVIRS